MVLGHLLSVSFVRTLKGDRQVHQMHGRKRVGEIPKNLNATYVNLHLSVEAIIEQEVVGHADSVGFHRMTLAIVIIPNVTWNKIKHQILNVWTNKTTVEGGIFNGLFSPHNLLSQKKKKPNMEMTSSRRSCYKLHLSE